MSHKSSCLFLMSLANDTVLQLFFGLFVWTHTGPLLDYLISLHFLYFYIIYRKLALLFQENIPSHRQLHFFPLTKGEKIFWKWRKDKLHVVPCIIQGGTLSRRRVPVLKIHCSERDRVWFGLV